MTRFVVYTFVGSFPWCLGLAWVGMKLGEQWNSDPRFKTWFPPLRPGHRHRRRARRGRLRLAQAPLGAPPRRGRVAVGRIVNSGRGAALLLAAAVLAAAPPASAVEVVRISVTASAAEVELSGPGLSAELLREGSEPRPVPGGRALLRLAGETLLLDGRPVDGAGVVFTSSGAIRHAGRALSGEVEVRRAPGGLGVIDVLPMEDYVAAVIGGEMPPSFPPEALKAQAVAARTFAVGKKTRGPGAGPRLRPRRHGARPGLPGRRSRRSPRSRRGRGHRRGGAGEGPPAHRGLLPLHVRRPDRARRRCAGAGPLLPAFRAVRSLPGVAVLALDAARPGGRDGGAGRPGRARRRASRCCAPPRPDAPRASPWKSRGEKVVLDGVELRRRLGYDRLPSLAFSVRASGGAFLLSGQGQGARRRHVPVGRGGARPGRRRLPGHPGQVLPGRRALRMY